MLSAEHRLRAADDFRTTVRKGVRVGRPLVVVHALPPAPSTDATSDRTASLRTASLRPTSGGAVTHGVPTPEATRAGFVVSRAVGTAVVRNAVKRRLRHLVQERLDLLPPGARIVVRAQPEAAHAPSGALARDLDVAFDRLVHRMAT